MACPCSPPRDTPDSVIACNGEVAVFDESFVSVYADRVGAQGGTGNWVRCLAITCLRVNRLLYSRNTPGDCGTGTTSGVNVVAGVAKAGLNIVANLLGGSNSPLSAIADIFAHHSQAVANEQNTICDVSNNWAGFASAMEQGLRSGQIGLQDAITKLGQFHQQFIGELGSVAKGINAGFGYQKALDALMLFNKEAIYPSLVPGVVDSILGPVSSLLGTSSKTSGVLVIGGAVVGAKIVGIF